MDMIAVRPDGSEQLLASGLTPGEVHEVLDWWRYTKPFGPAVRIVVKDQASVSLGVNTSGTGCEPPSTTRPSTDDLHSELIVG